jgi:predicted alpha/beta-hydrolase family hydrolase
LEQDATFEEITVPLRAPIDGVESISAVVGIPEWWPTGSRVAVALAHDVGEDMDDPLITCVHRMLARRKLLTIRFNFPFAQVARIARAEGKRVRKKRGAPTEPDLDALEKVYRAALSVLGRNPAEAPAHLFVGGKGIGSRVAARLASGRLQIEGAFFLGYPLHPPGKPEIIPDQFLFRIIAPMLFVQGTRDERCELDSLRRCLSRIGAPTTLRTIVDADHRLQGSTPPAEPGGADPMAPAIAESVAAWIGERLSQAD